jgi:hypothetical protein
MQLYGLGQLLSAEIFRVVGPRKERRGDNGSDENGTLALSEARIDGRA